ncbi:MAG: hypothetical protein RLZZ15_1555 [Verrucomicrobiota bacterium]|jgi:hypothetical protein
MKTLDHAIAHLESQLRFIPTQLLRRMAIFRLLNEQTGSAFSVAHRFDDLSRITSAAFWPLSPWRLGVIAAHGPTLNLLGVMSELHDYLWESTPGPGVCRARPRISRFASLRIFLSPLG